MLRPSMYMTMSKLIWHLNSLLTSKSPSQISFTMKRLKQERAKKVKHMICVIYSHRYLLYAMLKNCLSFATLMLVSTSSQIVRKSNTKNQPRKVYPMISHTSWFKCYANRCLPSCFTIAPMTDRIRKVEKMRLVRVKTAHWPLRRHFSSFLV